MFISLSQRKDKSLLINHPTGRVRNPKNQLLQIDSSTIVGCLIFNFNFNFSFTACYTKSVSHTEGMPATGADTQMWKNIQYVGRSHFIKVSIHCKIESMSIIQICVNLYDSCGKFCMTFILSILQCIGDHRKQGHRIWNVQALSESNLLEKWVQKWWTFNCLSW